MATTRRQERVNHLLHKELSSLIEFESSDPRLQGVTVSAVEISPDLKYARVFVVAGHDDDRNKEIRRGLHSAAPFLRHELAQRVKLRLVPELEFVFDRSFERGDRIEQLIREASRSASEE
jgi:ribosome-binding factor A